jgi:hypothetical protein
MQIAGPVIVIEMYVAEAFACPPDHVGGILAADKAMAHVQ